MKETKNLDFIGVDPGAVKHGNFINYYSFHKVEKRIENLHVDMFPSTAGTDIFCLDIGCNTGDLTRELYLYLIKIHPETNIHILGIDIDPNLIQRAQETNSIYNIHYMNIDIMSKEGREQLLKYLALCKRDSFDITFCFSVTMWIHLNNGDDGLLEFLQYLKNTSMTLVIEPQPWNCYRNAQRRVKKSGSTFEIYESLKIRSNIVIVIENILINIGFKKIYESPLSLWKRKIQSYICKH